MAAGLPNDMWILLVDFCLIWDILPLNERLEALWVPVPMVAQGLILGG